MILGLCCVKDSEAWMEDVLRSHLAICDHVLVLDDGSADRTSEIAQSFDRVSCFRQDGWPRNEARDRNALFSAAHAYRPTWCWWFDGDETVYRGTAADILNAPPEANTLRTFLYDLWGDASHYAADWSHQKAHIFRYDSKLCANYHWKGRGPHGLHCGARPRVPEYELPERMADIRMAELHWSWMNPGAVSTKLDFYREHDPSFDGFKPYRRFEKPPADVRHVPPR